VVDKMSLLEEKIVELHGELEGYKITSFGRVIGKRLNKPLCVTYDNNGYARVKMSVNGTMKTIRIHRLVAENFIPNPHNYPIVNHIDGNTSNPHVENLEWTTVKGNAEHAVKMGLLDTKGEKHHNATINEDQAREIIFLIKNGDRTSDIVKKLPFATKSIVEKIKSKQRWKHLT
jgi:hypothetical protein